MPVTARDLGGPPKGPPDLNLLLAGVFIFFLLFLGVRVILAALWSSPAPAAAVAAPTALAPLVIITPTPAASTPEPAPSATAVPEPTPASLIPGCPKAIALPEGASVGWVGRAAGCPDVALANLGAAQRWVLRGDLSDEIFDQLPEVQP